MKVMLIGIAVILIILLIFYSSRPSPLPWTDCRSDSDCWYMNTKCTAQERETIPVVPMCNVDNLCYCQSAADR